MKRFGIMFGRSGKKWRDNRGISRGGTTASEEGIMGLNFTIALFIILKFDVWPLKLFGNLIKSLDEKFFKASLYFDFFEDFKSAIKYHLVIYSSYAIINPSYHCVYIATT